MHYNIRFIKYPSGSIQVRYYSTPVFVKDDLTMQGEIAESVKKRVKKKYKNKDYINNPFDSEFAKLVDDFETDLKDLERSKKVSLNRTKNMFYSYARCEKWEWFLTFTFNKEKIGRYDFDLCSKAIRKFLNNLRRVAPDLKYLIVPELHKDGAIHFHGLLAGCDNLDFSFSGKFDKKKKPIYNLDNYKLGFTTAQRVEDYKKITSYCAKYITKSLCESRKGKRRFYASKNISLPETFVTQVNKKEESVYEYIESLANSLGYEIGYVSSVGSDYTKVSYFELQEVNIDE